MYGVEEGFIYSASPSLNVAAATAPLLAILLMRNLEAPPPQGLNLLSLTSLSMFSFFYLGWRLIANNITSLNPYFVEKRNARRGRFSKSAEALRNKISQSLPPKRMMFYIYAAFYGLKSPVSPLSGFSVRKETSGRTREWR
jgi:hypothetical protein